MESSRHRYGLTLVEMLVVVAVIVLLAGLTIGIGSHLDTQSKERAVKSTFAVLEAALQEYYDFWGAFPVANAADQNVNCEILYYALSSLPDSRKVLEHINEKLIRNKFNPAAAPAVQEIYDPWDTVLDYRYNAGDNFPRLISAGPNRIFHDGDDIANR